MTMNTIQKSLKLVLQGVCIPDVIINAMDLRAMYHALMNVEGLTQKF
jgi:hypothetical protein